MSKRNAFTNYFRKVGQFLNFRGFFDTNSTLSRLFGLFLVLVIACFFFVQLYPQKIRNELVIDYQIKPLHTVSDKFLSIGLDTSMIANGLKDLNLDSERFRNLTNAISPAYVRLGGTLSDRLIFADNINDNIFKKYMNLEKDLSYFLLDGNSWHSINKFCDITNLSLVFSVNVMLRNSDGWDPRNAIDIISTSQKHNYKIDWQLGNEPNSFPHVFNVSVPPEELVRNFQTLRHILNEYGYNKSLLIGPDTTRPQPNRPSCLQYMVEFLSHGSKSVNVISWHQYYLNSRTATLEDFWNPDTLDLLKTQIATMLSHTEMYMTNHQMWLSETSSSYGGGANGLSNTFASSPLWLDKLGLSAKNGISVVVRQSILGGFYSLISPNLDPLPDWWISWIYKKLINQKVIECNLLKSKHQRLYCGCATKEFCFNSKNCFVIYGLNLKKQNVDINLIGTALPINDYNIDELLVTAPSRRSAVVYVNNIKLEYDNALPILKPRKLGMSNIVTFAPYSLGFWIIQNSTLHICE